ncbi:Barstar (barnase inhibitor) [Microbispora sp. ATCC PTA-5024]|nr:Barstar (barnase inhibitor) [Microbispora sp. ATCC PTA-5024]
MARALALPDYFGRNWDALTDALRDTTGAGGVALVVRHAEDLLIEEPAEQFATLLAVLGAAAADSGLTVTLCTGPAHESPLRERLSDALP